MDLPVKASGSEKYSLVTKVSLGGRMHGRFACEMRQWEIQDQKIQMTLEIIGYPPKRRVRIPIRSEPI